ncbi:MAG: hypothetical protein QM817_09290 [Archangium sp.]
MKQHRLAVASLLVIVLGVLILCAWVCDDAFITFRTIKRFWSGDGLTWNPGERVQAYTHPLWMLLMLAIYGVTREAFFSSIVLSVLLSLGTVAALIALCKDRTWKAALLVFALIASRAFVDFQVSGLETPLLSLLLVAMVWCRERFFVSSLLLSMVFLTRADAVLLAAPLWLLGLSFSWKKLALALLGALPAIAWELFSYVYYGSWVPNTAIAKLNLDVERSLLLESGVKYLWDSLTGDPITLLVIVAGLGLAVRLGDRFSRALAIGAALYVAYVISIGGDFMSGRFLVGPLVAAACIVARTELEERAEKFVFIFASGYLALWPWTPIHGGWSYGADYREGLELTGVIDERAYYYPRTGLLPVLRGAPQFSGACMGSALAHDGARTGSLAGEAGYFGYFADDKVVIDIFALADPLLARIPYRAVKLRAGHYVRPMPAGYVETRLGGKNVIEDPGLRAAWNDLELVTRAPLWAPERWVAIRALASGAHREAFERASKVPRVPLTPPDPGACELE